MTRDHAWQSVLCLPALLLLVLLVYWPGLGGGFIFDDRPNIAANTALHVSTLRWDDWIAAVLSSPAVDLPRPLAMLTLAINHYFTGLDPWSMKLTNVAIHLFNTVLVFLLTRELVAALVACSGVDKPGLRTRWLPIFTAAAWALHPINVMAVLYVVQRMESLCHLFVFLGLWLYVIGRMRMLRGERGWPAVLTGLVGCALAGALSKESALLLPLYGFCLELCLFDFRARNSASRPWIMAFYALGLFLPALLALVWLLPPVLGVEPFDGRDFNLVERLLTEGRVLLDYLQWTLFPDIRHMSIYHDDYVVSRGLLDPASTLMALSGLAALLGLALWARRRRPLMALGVLWFFAAHAMTATIIPLELVFEHRNYFASFGICLALADLLLGFPSRKYHRFAGAALAIAFVVVVALGTGLRTWEWRNPLTFAISEAGKHPDSPRAVYALGVALSNLPGLKADSPVTVTAFKIFDHARSLPRSNILPDQAALMLAARVGLPLKQEWWLHMQSRLREKPIGPQELAALGGLNTCSIERRCDFPPEEMLETFRAAMSKGTHPELQNLLGNYVLNVLDQPELALFLWRAASEQRPRESQYRIGIIKLLIALGRDREASEEIARLRGVGRMGKFNAVADAMEARRQAELAARRGR